MKYLPDRRLKNCFDYFREMINLRTFRAEIMQTRQILKGNSERPIHEFSEKQMLTYLWRIGNQ